MGVRVEVLAPRLHAHVRTARLVRSFARSQRARRRHPRSVALARRHRAPPGDDAALRRPAVRRPPRLLLRRHRRDEPRAVRPARGRAGARRRLPHRVLRHALGPLPDGGVHQPHHVVRADGDALLLRVARAVASRPDLVPLEAARLPLRLHLAARDAAAPALRPAHALRLEGAAAGGDRQRPGDRDRGGGDVSPQPVSTLKGFGVTFRQILKKPITQQYPEERRPLYPRFRGRHRLWKHDNGLEKCVGCSLCAAACPADCIRVVAAENTPDNRVSAAERYARIYEINMSRCIVCGYCELACPFDAITLGNEFEISEHNRDDQIYTKDMLLAEPMKKIPIADPAIFDTPIPYYKSDS